MRRFEIGVSEAIPAAIRVYVPGREICPMARVLLLILFVLCGLPRQAIGQCYYTWEQFQNPPGDRWCNATAINELGHVVGLIASGSDFYRGFVWKPETGTVQLPTPQGVIDLQPYDINDAGHIVGAISFGNALQPFFWDGEQYTVIPLPPGFTRGEATGINNADEVVGTVYGNGIRAFRWHKGVYEDIGEVVTTEWCRARAINELGEVAGDGSSVGQSNDRAFVLDGAHVDWLPHPAGLTVSQARALSDNGYIVGLGWVGLPGDPGFRFVGLVWSDSTVQIVDGPPPGFRDVILLAVNNSGRSVGYFFRPGIRPIVWQNGIVQEVESVIAPQAPPGFFGSAVGINNRGQIACRVNSGSALLTPIRNPGDLTGDCRVGLDDLLLLLGHFGSNSAVGDVDSDGDIDLADLTVLLSHWGT